MTTATSLKDRYSELCKRVGEAAAKAGRSPNDVLIVAVTKHADVEQIRELVELGHQDFGENRVQQLVQRAAMIDEWLARKRSFPGAAARRASTAGALGGDSPEPADSVRWHMIGRLQRNKVKKAVEHARLIHSVDSMRLAEEIQSVCLKREEPADILLQVNTSGELSKAGVTLPAAPHVAEQIDSMAYVRLRGLMTMAPLTDDRAEIRDTFERCHECFADISTAGIGESHFNILSMGMSSDFELAIECGANVVRVGTSLFGESDIDDDEPEH